jgi:hypothetical protein
MRRDHNGKFSRATAKSNSGLPNGEVGISAEWTEFNQRQPAVIPLENLILLVAVHNMSVQALRPERIEEVSH